LHAFLTSALHGARQLHAPAVLPSGEVPCTHCIGGSGPVYTRWRSEKIPSLPPLGIESRSSSPPVA